MIPNPKILLFHSLPLASRSAYSLNSLPLVQHTDSLPEDSPIKQDSGLEAHPGPVEAHPGAMEAHPGTV
jgi:hypothetical protein